MNNIKLKAWDNDKKQMAKVKAIDWDCNDNIVTCHLEYKDGCVKKKYPMKIYGDDIEFLQCTGLKDTVGVEIYEWDILEYTSTFGGRTEIRNIVVSWSNEDGAFSFGGLRLGYVLRSSIIVGNIYENPELLE